MPHSSPVSGMREALGKDCRCYCQLDGGGESGLQAPGIHTPHGLQL